MFSQNNEEQIIIEYLNEKKGSFLDFGAGDGKTLSNTHALALIGFSGTCVEPSPEAFKRLKELYKDNPSIVLVNAAVSFENGTATFHHSGEHLKIGDVSLLSSLSKEETKRWVASGEVFEEIEVNVLTVDEILKQADVKKATVISIDIEGYDLICLRQLDLVNLETQLIIVEYNGNVEVLNEINEICNSAGLNKQLLKNSENIIWAK